MLAGGPPPEGGGAPGSVETSRVGVKRAQGSMFRAVPPAEITVGRTPGWATRRGIDAGPCREKTAVLTCGQDLYTFCIQYECRPNPSLINERVCSMTPSSHQASGAVPLRDKVYDSLHMEIITGKIPGGTRLVESALAAEMEVSRTPVREALQKLASQGFLHHIPRAGYIVEDMSDEDIQDLFSTREEIEKVAVRWASAKILPRELDSLRVNLNRTDEILQSGETHRMIELDTEFHHILYRATRSKTLFQISQSLSDRTLKFRIACIHFPEVARRAREGHARIVQALETGEEHSAESAVESHLVETRDDIIRSLKRIREENFMAGSPEHAFPPLRTGHTSGGR